MVCLPAVGVKVKLRVVAAAVARNEWRVPSPDARPCAQSRNTTTWGDTRPSARLLVLRSHLQHTSRTHDALVSHPSYFRHLPADAASRPFQSTYYDAQMRASPALLRARAPYLIKNTITGTAIVSLVIGICECQV